MRKEHSTLANRERLPDGFCKLSNDQKAEDQLQPVGKERHQQKGQIGEAYDYMRRERGEPHNRINRHRFGQ